MSSDRLYDLIAMSERMRRRERDQLRADFIQKYGALTLRLFWHQVEEQPIETVSRDVVDYIFVQTRIVPRYQPTMNYDVEHFISTGQRAGYLGASSNSISLTQAGRDFVRDGHQSLPGWYVAMQDLYNRRFGLAVTLTGLIGSLITILIFLFGINKFSDIF